MSAGLTLRCSRRAPVEPWRLSLMVRGWRSVAGPSWALLSRAERRGFV